MTLAQLARFDAPLRWPDILGGDTAHENAVRWRALVTRAEIDGLLRWVRCAGAWTLTDAGREAVAHWRGEAAAGQREDVAIALCE